MQVVLVMLGVAAVGAVAGFAIRRWGVLYLLAAVAFLSSAAILINGSSTANEGWFSAPGLVLFVVVVYWLPFGIGMASGIALRRKGRPMLGTRLPSL